MSITATPSDTTPAATPASTAVSAKYPVACPTCHAKIKQPCRSMTTNRVTDTHQARIDAAYPSHTL